MTTEEYLKRQQQSQKDADEALRNYQNLGEFQFNYNENDSDLLALRNKYTTDADRAMKNTMGNSASLTGGYANSWGQQVAQQTYQDYMDQLHSKEYEYKQNEYNKQFNAYSDKRNNLLQLYNLYKDRLDTDTANYNASLQNDIARQQAIYGSGGGSGAVSSTSRSSDFETYNYKSKADGKTIFDYNGKEVTLDTGINPYTRTTNKDVKNGTFSNGYQPNNVNGVKLKKTGDTDVVNGVTQNIWYIDPKDNPNANPRESGRTIGRRYYIWDGTKNQYMEYRY